jgi:CBS domain-containing protein
MIPCPACGVDNLEGADECKACQQSLTDLSRPQPRSTLEKGLMSDRIDLLQPHQPLTVSPGDTIGNVLKKMVAEKIGCVIVMEGDELHGIFTEFDALMKINTSIDSLKDRPISSVMTDKPVTLNLENKIAYALHQMHVGGYRHLPILSSGKLVGVSSIRDILNYLAKRLVPAG